MAGELRRFEHGVFGLADLADNLARGQFSFVDIVGFEHAPDNCTTVVFVVNRKIRVEPEAFSFIA